MKIEEAIKQLKETGKKRGFKQSFDLIVNITNIDLKKPENKFSKDINLPHGRGKEITVSVISDNVQGAITKKDLESLTGDLKKIKEFINKSDFFICEAPLMPLTGKVLGKYLGPKGKMPKLLPPNADPKPIIENTKKSVTVRLRESPVIQTMIGTEAMDDPQIKENAEKVIEEIKKSLPGKARIKSTFLKLTMSKPVKIS
jgi:large subunit ribosomal protein L1